MSGQCTKNPVCGTDDSSISANLLDRLRCCDANAWTRLIRLFGPKVYQWCRAAGLQPDDAADVGQEVFRAVVGGVGRLRRQGPADTFGGWLWRITQHKLRDYWRQRGRRPEAFGGSSIRRWIEQVPDQYSRDSGSSSEFERLMAALATVQADVESRTWQAFWLVTIEGWTAREAAGRLAMSRGAVYVAKSRVLRRLRDELDAVRVSENDL